MVSPSFFLSSYFFYPLEVRDRVLYKSYWTRVVCSRLRVLCLLSKVDALFLGDFSSHFSSFLGNLPCGLSAHRLQSVLGRYEGQVSSFDLGEEFFISVVFFRCSCFSSSFLFYLRVTRGQGGCGSCGGVSLLLLRHLFFGWDESRVLLWGLEEVLHPHRFRTLTVRRHSFYHCREVDLILLNPHTSNSLFDPSDQGLSCIF